MVPGVRRYIRNAWCNAVATNSQQQIKIFGKQLKSRFSERFMPQDLPDQGISVAASEECYSDVAGQS
jgi:hypothetical protein